MKDRVKHALEAAGMSCSAVAAKSEGFEKLLHATEPTGAGGGENRFACFVPGRIEVLGKHTDYAGGRSLVCTVERGFSMVCRPRRDNRIRILDAASGERVETLLSPEIVPASGHWSNYPMTVARRLARNFSQAEVGVDLAFLSDLPPASGMSSSSAFIVGIFLALAEVNALRQFPEYRHNIYSNEDLAGYLGTIENGRSFRSLVGDRGVGTFGGSEDHTAILCCRPEILSQYSYCPVRHEQDIDLPRSFLFVVGCSGVQAEKTGAALQSFNRAANAAQRVLEIWHQVTGKNEESLAAAASAPGAWQRLLQILAEHHDASFAPGILAGRFRQFYEESFEIVGGAAAALRNGDMRRFGLLVDRSQHNAELLLGNQVEETIALCRIAREGGAIAASAFGAGFGGSVWALLPADKASQFLESWSNRYRQLFPEYAGNVHFFVSRPGPAAIQFRMDEGNAAGAVL